MVVDPELETRGPALTQARIVVTLDDGRAIDLEANGARGNPVKPARADELESKFRACAAKSLAPEAIERALAALGSLDEMADVRVLTAMIGATRARVHGRSL